MLGKSDYTAHAGACTWANGVYWLKILDKRPDGLLLVENLNEEGKLDVPPVQAPMEPDLVYPLLRGRDVDRWRAHPSAYILMVQDPQKRTGYDESWLRVHLPHTYAYLAGFEWLLRQRSGYRKYFDQAKDAFYSMYDVAEYTFTPYKVAWPWIATRMAACVAYAAVEKSPIPEHNTSFVGLHDEQEAHYLCALLNSSPSDLCIRARTAGGGGGLASPSILENVRILVRPAKPPAPIPFILVGAGPSCHHDWPRRKRNALSGAGESTASRRSLGHRRL